MTHQQQTSRSQGRLVSLKPATGRAETFDELHAVCETAVAGFGESRPTLDSAPPPNTGHFGEFVRLAAAKASPEVEAAKRFTQNTKSNSPPRIHHQHHPATESGDAVASGLPMRRHSDVTLETTKASGESIDAIANARNATNGGLVVKFVVKRETGIALALCLCLCGTICGLGFLREIARTGCIGTLKWGLCEANNSTCAQGMCRSEGDAMQLGFVSSIFGDVPLAEVIHFAGEEGFDCVELMCWPREGSFAGVCHVDAAALSDSAAEQVNQMCADAAVEVSALGYYPNVLSSNAIEAASARDHLCKVIDAAVLLGFSTVNTFIGGDHRKPADENLRTFAEVWPELIRYAEDRGVLIGIENCPMLLGEESWPSGTNVARSPEVWRLMFATIPSENFGLNLDPSHLVWQFIDPVEPIHQFSDRLFHVHAKDTHVDRRRLNEIGVLGMGWHTPKLPGKGDIDWRQWIAALKTVGYEGAICIEVEDEDYYGSLETRKEALRVAGDLLRPLIDEEA